MLFGLSRSHTRAHHTRAVLEGVAYALKSVCEAMEEQGGGFESLSLIGGMAMGEVYREILAGVLNKTLVLPADPEESTARGAAIAAAVASGILGNYSDARPWIKLEGEVEPDPGEAAVYARHYAVWKGLYPALKQSFKDAADLS